MARYAAFLRAVNLGGHRAVKKEELCACFESLGFKDVATFRASGNVIFASEKKEEAEKVAARIEAGLANALGYEVPVLLRTATQVRAIARHQPFGSQVSGAEGGKLQVALLPRKPSAAARKQALALQTDQDPLAIRAAELYWLPRGQMRQSRIDLKGLEAVLGPWTMRTMGTIEEVAARCFAG
jgi:uncharacterized protein (DUF1697 family)